MMYGVPEDIQCGHGLEIEDCDQCCDPRVRLERRYAQVYANDFTFLNFDIEDLSDGLLQALVDKLIRGYAAGPLLEGSDVMELDLKLPDGTWSNFGFCDQETAQHVLSVAGPGLVVYPGYKVEFEAL